MFDWFFTQLGFSCVLMVVLVGLLMSAAGFCTFVERKVAAYVQDRWGPNRAGPGGLLQPLADGIKLLFKEDFIPASVDRIVFVAAPMIALAIALLGLAVIPWGGLYLPPGAEQPIRVQVASVDVGLLYLLAIGALSVHGIVLAGWSSNNKYSFYGAMRAAAQMLSYEIPLALAILTIVLASGEVRLERIVTQQTEYWWGVIPKYNVFLYPVPFAVLFIASLAETNRAPFDLAEAEQELVLGFHTEYNAMKFGAFFLGEYSHMMISSALIITLFLGGWHVPGIKELQHSLWGVLLQFAVLWIKIAIFILIFMWIRWTLPRFRFDQVMKRAWLSFVPLMMLLVACVCVLIYFGKQHSWWALLCNGLVLVVAGAWIALRPGAVTGRQAHLQPLPTPGRRRLGGAPL